VAYVSSDSVIQYGNGDTLIVDASIDRIKGGLTAAKVLDKAFRKGAEIFSCTNLHAKVYIFDGTAVIGSPNTSTSSTDRLLEAAIITDEPKLTSAARRLIGELRLKSKRLSEADIQRLLKIPVERRFSPGPRRTAPSVSPSPGATWLVSTWPLDMTRFANEEQVAESGEKLAEQLISKRSSETSWIRFGKKQNIAQRAQEGDWLIQVSRQKRDGRVTKVFRCAPIRYIQQEPKCVRIYWEDFKNSELESIGWGEFQKIARSAGIPERRLGKRSVGLLTDGQAETLESLWKAQLKPKRK